ncbi:class I SAM-dependent methyltransferase [Pseudomonas syringae]|uniref:Ribosomal RNA small subunit methyltransferase C n=11 Tax=Pseudomonas syringae TaxID=317 RepID=A0A3M4KFF8_PSESF|nr:class I SAM-dependent methyltransferase [Pseudomonas syringae]EPM43971.1 ribosomal RNA small subunit methyltransferase C [Pseudomonas syringae pv. actinidiae ICMP 19098]EPN15055.1 ribosomal RNA small subunit methyltransferase C [Pseudomonas syringae pv. actinidiae ICMP 19100]EPN23540.1 ribosomal RNA small subunit methyltransferase C [Pseudomonas syringae pv. actinidiae ICMP 19099]EPN31044.1 ribosomal RNA small subunit methyltransferase C [Pseudomonas syringae pv. actinidiae ICMP 18883]KTC48
MDPRSEVLLRQPELFQGSLLLVGLPADDLLGKLPNARGWCWHAGDQAALDARFEGRVEFGVEAPEAAFDAAVLFLPKARDLTDYLLNALASRLAGRELFLVGEKRGGIEAAAKQLSPFGRARKLDSARHCQLWQVTVENAPQAVTLESLARPYQIELQDGPLTVISLPGVFSHGRLDRGSALLLENIDKLPSGNLLDFGCGAGVLGAAVKRRYPHNDVVMLDVDAFATASSRLTLAANGLEAQVLTGDGIDAAPMGLNTILSNPPFHVGVHTDYMATENLLKKARQHLKSGGELRLVANNFLRYQPLIEEHVGYCHVKAQGNGFKIYSAKRS